MSDETTIRELVSLINDYNLEGKTLVESYTFKELARDYNGMGPEWFPESVRKTLDKIFKVFSPAFLIHDTEWAHAKGTRHEFNNSNARLERNCKRIADCRYGWYNPLRYWRRHQGALFAQLCQSFGHPAFIAASKKNHRS